MLVITMPNIKTPIFKFWSIIKQNRPTKEPMKLERTLSMVSLRESFPSGEITKMIDNNNQNSSYSGKANSNLYPMTKPIKQRTV